MKELELKLRKHIEAKGLTQRLAYIHEGQRGFVCMFQGSDTNTVLFAGFETIYTKFSATIGCISNQNIETL